MPPASYDFRGGEVAEADLEAALADRIDGDVRFDDYTRTLYATDASIYEVTPIGVVFPRSHADVERTVSFCADRDIPVLPRGGGTSLAGQAVNVAVVLDFTRYMDAITSIDPDAKTATLEAGAYLGTLNERAGEVDLQFGPDPAWGDKSTIGGAIGNNSTGAHSLTYDKTDAYVRSCRVVFADGTSTTVEREPIEDLEARADPDGDGQARLAEAVCRILDDHRESIEAVFPDLKRNVAGYNLDGLLESIEEGTINPARLLAGSEGTLGIVTEATVELVPQPAETGLALLQYASLQAAMDDVPTILDHEPSALEVLDDVLLDLARGTEEFGGLVESLVPPETGAILLVEFDGDTHDIVREAVETLCASRADQPAIIRTETAFDVAKQARFWKLRKSGLPILLSRTSDAKHIAFIEDTAVPPESLGEYVAAVQTVLEDHDTFASFYAHAGPGVLHIRPLINTKDSHGVETMESIADAVTDLVIEYGGSIAGEHGDGRARTQWLPKQYGQPIWECFRDLKATVDPAWRLNPGQVCGTSQAAGGDPISMTENLRFDPDYHADPGFEPSLHWDCENGFEGMVELCHGCGGCRGEQSTTGGIMCPTYRASEEEIASTRGRANLLRKAITGELSAADHRSEEFREEVMDLCIGCKGCLHDCPSGVDMAKLKAEITYEHHQEAGASLRDHLFANIDTLARIGSALAPVSNWISERRSVRRIGEWTLGINADRPLPTFATESFESWFEAHEGPANVDRTVWLMPDFFTNFVEPSVGKAAVRVLEAAGVKVKLVPITDVGRPHYSLGFLDRARSRAQNVTRALENRISPAEPLVVLEPSDAVMIQEDYASLLGSDGVGSVPSNTYSFAAYCEQTGVAETIDVSPPPEPIVYHSHCHQASTGRAEAIPAVFEEAGFDLRVVDSGCCGMAGTFGYEAEHAEMSRAIGSILLDQLEALPSGPVVASGGSCRSQLRYFEAVGRDIEHPAILLAAALEST